MFRLGDSLLKHVRSLVLTGTAVGGNIHTQGMTSVFFLGGGWVEHFQLQLRFDFGC